MCLTNDRVCYTFRHPLWQSPCQRRECLYRASSSYLVRSPCCNVREIVQIARVSTIEDTRKGIGERKGMHKECIYAFRLSDPLYNGVRIPRDTLLIPHQVPHTQPALYQ